MVSARVDIPTNLACLGERIEGAARRAGRDPAEVTLVAVTKTHPVEMVRAAYRAGVRQFGENRVEEGQLKISAFDEWLAASSEASQRPTWHMIGHLQSRKAGDALAYFDVIHSVDSLKLAQRLNRLAERDVPGRGGIGTAGALPDRLPMPILLECNVSGEASKYGFALSRWQEDRQARTTFFDVVRRIVELPQLRLQGLMTMAPIVPEPQQVRPVFAALRTLRDALAEEFPAVAWRHLSMGMTDDFEVAIEEGATLVRVGRAIFGPRETNL
ncbi:MAG: YggS family pyridoxal phosphate-dependent enzyme [Anaerolineae bacterium]|jgi:pyridoxal phosphate enzyme (YggS family)